MPTRIQSSSNEHSNAQSPSKSPPHATATQQSLAMRQREDSRSLSGTKRKRTNTATTGGSSSMRRRTQEPEDVSDNDDDDDLDDVYDPDQPLEERRKVQQGFRDLLRDITENSEEYLQGDSDGLHQTILRANELSKQVRQTTEATIDSRLLVSTTDLSYRKTLRLTQGSLSQGIDVDDTQRQRRRVSRGRGDDDENDDVGDEGDMMNWSHMGRFACLPHIRRPALPSYLLGPLSVEKKARRITKRSAPFRPNNLTETRPEVLNIDDLARKENDLTAICRQILQQLYKLQADTQETVADLIEDDMDDEEKTRIMHQHGLRSTGGIDLMRFVVNPKSFGQTVENLFYVSFLIRDGKVEIDFDEFDLPALAPVDRDEEEEGAVRQGASKHQAILSMDMVTWRDIIDTFNLVEPMIEHREESSISGPGARGWYS
ncbi:Non-structural maintenance of chromosome element 4-like protein [Cladobotryum mycophilum]|uniref:Non-structural maintenance of chromosomes element 4 n=1 Tax=Cladobotryum mycophilum TaxID=491253 RepID=A0ABR0SFP9_9HYPO